MPYPESNHPYDALPNRQFWTYTDPGGAARLAVTFDPLTEVENYDDYIRIEKADGQPIAIFTGVELAGLTVVLPGPTFKIELFSDGSVQKWGFRITDIQPTTNALTYPCLFQILDPADEPEPVFPPNQSYSWEYSGKLWMIAWGPTASGQWGAPPYPVFAPNARVYYSANGGLTWTESDSANRPVDPEPMGVWYDGAGMIWLVHRNNTNPYALVLSSFDMSANGGTGAWTTPVSTGPNGANQNNSNDVYVTEDPNDSASLLVLFTAFVAGNGQVYWVRAPKDGSAWSSPVLVSTSGLGTYRRASGILAHDGRTSLFWMSTTSFSVPIRLYHRTLDAADVLQSVQLVGQMTDAMGVIFRATWPVIFGAKIGVGYMRASSGTAYPAIFWGDPAASDTPTWTTEDISSPSNVDAAPHNSNPLALLVSGSTLYAFWITKPIIGPVILNELLWASYDGSSWTDLGAFWSPQDATNFIDDFVSSPSPFIRSDGSIGMAIMRVNPSYDWDWPNNLGFETSVAGFMFCALGPVVVALVRRARVFYYKPFFPPR